MVFVILKMDVSNASTFSNCSFIIIGNLDLSVASLRHLALPRPHFDDRAKRFSCCYKFFTQLFDFGFQFFTQHCIISTFISCPIIIFESFPINLHYNSDLP